MRKALVIAGLMIALSFASAKGYFGVFSGYPEVIGVQYTMDSGMRFSLGVPYTGAFGIAGSADMILGTGPLEMEDVDLSYYYGAGLSAAMYFPSSFMVNGHGLAGVEWVIPETTFGVFFEAQLGVRYVTWGPPHIGPFFGGRIGVNFH